MLNDDFAQGHPALTNFGVKSLAYSVFLAEEVSGELPFSVIYRVLYHIEMKLQTVLLRSWSSAIIWPSPALKWGRIWLVSRTSYLLSLSHLTS